MSSMTDNTCISNVLVPGTFMLILYVSGLTGILCIFQSSDVTVYKLKDEIEDAASRLMFLLDYAIFPCKDTIWV